MSLLFQLINNQRLPIILWVILAGICPFTAYGSTSALIPQYDETTVCTVLVDEIPDLSINTVTLISAGWDNLVAEINGEWIFRFPRREEFKEILERERLLLERLQNTVSMPIPHYEYIGLERAFVGYRKLHGGALSEKLYLECANESRQEIAESLALFLSQLHHAVSVEEAFRWGYKQYHIPLEWIEQNLCGTLHSREIERIIDEALIYAKQNPCSTKNLVLLHNDLHGENLAFNVKTKQVAGVFDFSDAAIGDYSVEFGKLFTIHQDLALRAAGAYANLNDVEDPTVPAAVDYILRRALYILHARESGDVLRETSLVQMLNRFVPIWDELKIKVFL